MTKEELTKIPFNFVSHWSLSDCHITTYENKQYGIIWEQSTKKKNDFEFGRTTEKFCYKDKWYSKKKFINEIIKDIEL